MNIVLNDSTPVVTPTNGCCAGVADESAQPYISMSVNGAPGNGTNTVLVNNASSTVLY
jgi:hypothetical protein